MCLTLLSGCGGSSPSPSGNGGNEPAENLTDINGTWVSEVVDEEDGVRLVALVDEGYAGLFWLTDEEEYPAFVEWMGTIENNGHVAEGKPAVSTSVRGQSGDPDSSETFTYKDGTLVFSVGIEYYSSDQDGETVFTRGEWDTSRIRKADWGENAMNVKDLVIKDSSWFMQNGDLFYYIVVENPNSDVMISGMRIDATAKDKNGNVIASSMPELLYIYPDQEIVMVGYIAFMINETPETVEYEADTTFKNLYFEGEYEEIKPLEIKNVSISGYNVSGKVSNPEGDKRYFTVGVVVYDDSGNITDMEAISYNVAGNGETEFDITMHTSSNSNAKIYLHETSW